MFGVSGPPLVFQFYRQPFSLVQIRCALIVLFAATALIRTLFSAWHGQLGREVWTQAVLAVPVVALATVAARRYPPPLSSGDDAAHRVRRAGADRLLSDGKRGARMGSR